jgi:hypothetical protein
MIFRPYCRQDHAVENKLFEGRVAFGMIVVEIDGKTNDGKSVNVARNSCVKFGCDKCSK